MRNETGMTLIEVLLVLVIASMIMVLGLRMYSQYERSADIYELQYNVDTIFQAMSRYYNANCNSPAFLDLASPIPVDLETLTKEQYLTRPLNPVMRLIDLPSSQAYRLQFNPSAQNYIQSGVIKGTVAVWSMQITVQPITTGFYGTPAGRVALSSMLGSDCMSRIMYGTGTFLVYYPCRTMVGTGTNPSWERMISNAGSRAASTGYWMTTPTVRMFRYIVSPTPAGGVYSCGG